MGAEMVYESTEFDLRFVWHGGAYIDIFYSGAPAPFANINAWDYSTDKPMIPVTLTALADEAEEWISENK